MIVSELSIYPLKSGRGIKLQQAQVNSKGLRWDREMMLVSSSGKFITQRQFLSLAKVEVQIVGQKVTLSSKDSPNNLTFSLSSRDVLTEV